ncbi:MAG: hypothetical protein MI757_16020, partial [Pirellulales bacterium]|nr:hypothetical protein [Pirellulales bacterium]
DTVADFGRIATPGPTKKTQPLPSDSDTGRKKKSRTTAGALAERNVDAVASDEVVTIELGGEVERGEDSQKPTLLEQRAAHRIQNKKPPTALWVVVGGMVALACFLLFLLLR